jgi:hypothetical protein
MLAPCNILTGYSKEAMKNNQADDGRESVTYSDVMAYFLFLVLPEFWTTAFLVISRDGTSARADMT